MQNSLFLILASLMFFCANGKAYVCSDLSPDELWKRSEWVFFGKLLRIERQPGHRPILHMQVLKLYKGGTEQELGVSGTVDMLTRKGVSEGNKFVIFAAPGSPNNPPSVFGGSNRKCTFSKKRHELLQYDSEPTVEQISLDILEKRNQFGAELGEKDDGLGKCRSPQRDLFDAGKCQPITGGTCWIYPSYVVVTKEHSGIGENIRARLRGKGKPECEKGKGWQLELVTRDEADYFMGIVGDYLFVDSGTGPDRRGLAIHDIKNKRVVFVGISERPLQMDEAKRVVRFWRPTSTAATPKSCVGFAKIEKQALVPVIEEEVALTLASGKIVTSKKRRCEARQ